MSRQSKYRHQRRSAASSKGHMAGADKHFAQGVSRPKFPDMQPAPCWIKSTSKRGWWGKKSGAKRETAQSNA